MGHQTRLSLLKIIISILFLVSISCGGNVFQESSGKSTSDAIFEAVKRATNDGDFTRAVEIINANPNVVPSSREEKMIYGSALAGNCGVTFAGLVSVIGNTNITSTTLLYSMQAFASVTTNANDCKRAQSIIESIGDAANRSLSENLALFMIGFSKVGTYLKESADTAAPFGTVDPGFNACMSAQLSTAHVKEMITGLAIMIETSDALVNYVGSDLSDSLDDIELLCGATCSETNADDIDDTVPQVATDILNFRRAIASDEFGVSGCTVVTCCP